MTYVIGKDSFVRSMLVEMCFFVIGNRRVLNFFVDSARYRKCPISREMPGSFLACSVYIALLHWDFVYQQIYCYFKLKADLMHADLSVFMIYTQCLLNDTFSC